MIPCRCFDYVRRFRTRTPILYFAMAESGNNFRNSGHAWTTPAIGNLCSFMNSKNNTSARMTLRSLFRAKNYVTFRMLNGSAIYLSASLNSPIYFSRAMVNPNDFGLKILLSVGFFYVIKFRGLPIYWQGV